MHRFISHFDLSQSSVRVSDPDLIHQWSKVLRFQPGDEVVLVNGSGEDAQAKFVSLSKSEASLEVVARQKNKREPACRVHLYAAILKRENFDLLVQKAVEAGVGAITPLITERTVKLTVKQDRLQKIAREAAEQSGREIVPQISAPVKLAEAIASLPTDINAYWCEIDAPKLVIPAAVTEVTLFVGPEGGWSPAETALAKAKTAAVGLGSTVLRAETAGIIAVYLAAQK